MGWMVGLVAALALVGACGIEDPHHRAAFHDDSVSSPEFDAMGIGDPFGQDSAADFLTPEERDAVRRSGMTGVHADEPAARMSKEEQDQAKSGAARTADKAGKVGVALLSVGMTLGAVVAPFFLF